jgi:hypothetical protein
MSRKTRSDASPFDRFREELDQWLTVDNLSYDDALAKLKAVWPVDVRAPSRSALARWAEGRRQEQVLDRIAKSAASARQVQDTLAANPGDAYASLLGLIGQAAFEMRMKAGDELSIDTLKDLAQVVQVGLAARNEEAKLRLREQEIGLKERRIVLLERQSAEATDVVRDTALTPEQKMARFREIFGLA